MSAGLDESEVVEWMRFCGSQLVGWKRLTRLSEWSDEIGSGDGVRGRFGRARVMEWIDGVDIRLKFLQYGCGEAEQRAMFLLGFFQLFIQAISHDPPSGPASLNFLNFISKGFERNHDYGHGWRQIPVE